MGFIRSRLGLAFWSGLAAALWLVASPVAAQTEGSSGDRHQGYYYPAPQSAETYVARVATSPQADRRTRIAFVTGITAQNAQAAYAPSYHIFAKGTEGEKFIIVSVDRTKYQTLYQLRALLAAMTALARNTPVFQEQAVPESLTFLDLCKMMGVKLLTISNGDSVAHQFTIE
ncbi:MAG: hypothetical protein QNJ84_03195 [Alphaproteobacteria bacterium]|nr:hypothetical protein [Alphaproteobacteria bacterium]